MHELLNAPLAYSHRRQPVRRGAGGVRRGRRPAGQQRRLLVPPPVDVVRQEVLPHLPKGLHEGGQELPPGEGRRRGRDRGVREGRAKLREEDHC